MKLPLLKELIEPLGANVLACELHCEGITRKPEEGHPSRGLHLEEDEHGRDDGVIVCGLNPGSPQKDELKDYRDRFRQGTLTYAVIQGYWEENLCQHRYLESSRKLVWGLGFRGPILWTNVAKCEREDSERRISFDTNPQTFRFCADRFLRHEIKACPVNWPIIANGKDAFVAVSYMFPERLIIGIPHPTGAHPNFSRMFLSPGVLRPDIVQRVSSFVATCPQGALWLGAEAGVGSRAKSV